MTRRLHDRDRDDIAYERATAALWSSRNMPLVTRVAVCDCAHPLAIHSAMGCDGVYGVLDERAGIGQAGPCPCRRYFEETR